MWLDCLATQRIEKTHGLRTTKKSFLLKHVCETINNKQSRFAFLANRRRKNIVRGRVVMRCNEVPKVWDFEILYCLKFVRSNSGLEWKRCFFGSLGFLLGPFSLSLRIRLIMPFFMDQYLDKKWFLIGCSIRDN